MSNHVGPCVPPRLQRQKYDGYTHTSFGNCWQRVSGRNSAWR